MPESSANPVLAEIVRGPLVESRHRASVVAIDTAGNRLIDVGDTGRVVLPRSSLKPLQALTMIESGAADAFRCTDEEIALHCASHSGEEIHVDKVSAWLERIGRSEADLECGVQRPLAELYQHLLPDECPAPSRLTNNCSGKHAGFMTTALHLGIDPAGYTDPDHQVQARVRATIAELTGEPESAMITACDNCRAPAFGVSLAGLARAAARMARPEGLDEARADATRRVVEAMRSYPELVAGTRRCDTLVMSDPAFDGAVKCGAEGVFMAILPGQGIGLALKVDDGASRAADALLVAALHKVGALDEPAFDRLSEAVFYRARGSHGDTIARIRCSFPG